MTAIAELPMPTDLDEIDFDEDDFIGERYLNWTNPDGTKDSAIVPLTEDDLIHPQYGDKVVNNPHHSVANNYLVNVFRWRLKDRPGTIIFEDHGINWGVPGLQTLSPDVCVVFDSKPFPVKESLRTATFHVRKMAANTPLIMELTSKRTRRKDFREKVELYGRAGVPHYVIADLVLSRKNPAFEFFGFRNTKHGLQRYEHDPQRIWLPEMELWVVSLGTKLRCELPDGTPVPDDDAIREIAELEKHRADEEQRRADGEKQRADALAAELAALKARLNTLSTNGH